MLLMMLISVPLYVCASASVPVAAALMLKGITPGAAFVFLMAGPATNAATIAAAWKTLGKKCAILYLVVIAFFSIAFGLLLDYLFESARLLPQYWEHAHHGLPLFAKNTCAILLLLIIGYAKINGLPEKNKKLATKRHKMHTRII